MRQIKDTAPKLKDINKGKMYREFWEQNREYKKGWLVPK